MVGQSLFAAGLQVFNSQREPADANQLLAFIYNLYVPNLCRAANVYGSGGSEYITLTHSSYVVCINFEAYYNLLVHVNAKAAGNAANALG